MFPSFAVGSFGSISTSAACSRYRQPLGALNPLSVRPLMVMVISTPMWTRMVLVFPVTTNPFTPLTTGTVRTTFAPGVAAFVFPLSSVTSPTMPMPMPMSVPVPVPAGFAIGGDAVDVAGGIGACVRGFVGIFEQSSVCPVVTCGGWWKIK